MTSIKPTSVPSKTLAQSINGSATTFEVSDILGWDGAALASSDFGAQAYGMFHNSAKTAVEIFEFDPATIASSAISFVRRGLKFDGDLTTEVSGNKLTWVKGDTRVLLGTDVPQLFKNYVDIHEAQTVGGEKTFSVVPKTTGGNPVADNDLARKAYVDALVLGTLTTINVIVPGTAGETIAAGNLVYFDDAQNKWYKTDADTAATVQNVLLAVAQGAGTANNPITNGVMLQGVDDNQTGLTNGQTYYASNTAGGISSSAGTTEVTIGIGKSATELYFNPRFDQQVTEDQQDALAGNGGTPSAANKFTTQTGFQAGTEIYAADAGADDTYVITLSPAPTAYVTGMKLAFKANTANTGTATLNVNSLGAKTIVKGVSTTLDTGDIAASQIISVIYDGTNFVLQSPTAQTFRGLYASGNTTYVGSTATGTQTIAHGLGVTPVGYRLIAVGSLQGEQQIAHAIKNNKVSNGSSPSGSASYAGAVFQMGDGTNQQTGSLSADATNISISWTKVGSGYSGTINIIWEAFA